jgi:hypothetical protein
MMPIQPNFLERTAFFTLNAAPGPMLDLAGALAFQAVNTAVQLNLFTALQERPLPTPNCCTPANRMRSRSFSLRLKGRWKMATVLLWTSARVRRM